MRKQLCAYTRIETVLRKDLFIIKNPHEGNPRKGNEVDLEGVEPSSAQGNHTLSTRLFQPSVFERQQDLDHQLTP